MSGFEESYKAAREGFGLCDLGEEGRLKVTGPDALEAVNALFSKDLMSVLPGAGIMGLFLRDNGEVLALATVFVDEDENIYVFTEADTAEALARHLSEHLRERDVELEDLSETHGLLSVLGPKAQEAMVEFAGEDILGLPYLGFEHNERIDQKIFRMGGCGEFEYRLLVPRQDVERLNEEILSLQTPVSPVRIDPQVMPVLELEMRTIRHADIPEGATPIDMGLHWMIDFRKESFPGSEAVRQAKEAPSRRAVMVSFEPGSAVEKGDELFIEDRCMGEVLRVVPSLTLGRPVGLALTDPEFGWVGVHFLRRSTASKEEEDVCRVTSAPLFITQTALQS